MPEESFSIAETDTYKKSIKELKKKKYVDPASIEHADKATKWTLGHKPEDYKIINPETGVRYIEVSNRSIPQKKQIVVFGTFYKVCERKVCLYKMWASLPEWRM